MIVNLIHGIQTLPCHNRLVIPAHLPPATKALEPYARAAILAEYAGRRGKPRLHVLLGLASTGTLGGIPVGQP